MVDLTPSLLSGPLAGIAWLVAVCVLVLALRGASLKQALSRQTFPALLVALLVVWQLRAVTPDGPALHLLGAALLQLCAGWRLAMLGMAVVLAAHTVNGAGGLTSYGANFVLMGALPVTVSHLVTRTVNRRLPGNPFGFILIAGFAGAGLSMVAVLFATVGLLLAAGTIDADRLFEQYAYSGLLIVFPEAFVTGLIIAPLAMFYPQTVAMWAPPWEP